MKKYQVTMRITTVHEIEALDMQDAHRQVAKIVEKASGPKPEVLSIEEAIILSDDQASWAGDQ